MCVCTLRMAKLFPHISISPIICIVYAYMFIHMYLSLLLAFTDPANITQVPVSVTVNQTFTAQFVCTSFGNPIPLIVWSRVGDDDLSDNVDIVNITTIVNTDMYTVTSYLIIRSTERFRDQGVYNCTASNDVTNNVGAVNIQSAELIVQGNYINLFTHKSHMDTDMS